MSIKDLIQAGHLSDARSQLVEKVKASPADTTARTLLFQILVLCGEWNKAERHLDAIEIQDGSIQPAFLHYKSLIAAERERLKVLSLETLPSFLPKTPAYFSLYYQGVQNLRNNKTDEAAELFRQVESQVPNISGTINGKKFTGFKDTDTALAYFLETIAHGRYVWIPFEAIRELTVMPPETLFDLIWASATLTTWEGLTLNCTLPVLYPDSSSAENNQIKMGRMTDWLPMGGSFTKGLGQHVFETEEDDIALLEIQEAVFTFSEQDEKE